MEHNHNHERPASLKYLFFAIVINGGIVLFEMVFGLMIQSMALISDAVRGDGALQPLQLREPRGDIRFISASPPRLQRGESPGMDTYYPAGPQTGYVSRIQYIRKR